MSSDAPSRSAAEPTVPPRWTSERKFFTGIGIVSSGLVIVGFAPTFYLRPFFRLDGLRPILWAHGLVFSLWLALFVAQTVLVALRQMPRHRALGVFGGVIAVAMVLVGFATAVDSAHQQTLMGVSPNARCHLIWGQRERACSVRYVRGWWCPA